MTDRHESGFKETTSLADSRVALREVSEPIERTQEVALDEGDGRVLAAAVSADRDVPHYDRAAMDGFAVRAEDTFGATDRSPSTLRLADGSVEPGTAVPVHTGSAVPEGADAVAPIEVTDERGESVLVTRAAAVGGNVAPRGEDVEAGQKLLEPGAALGPSDLGLLKSVGVETVETVARPSVHVITTGEELVDADPSPGEAVATNDLTVARFVERWGGTVAARRRVSDDPAGIGAAVEDGLDADVVVTTGGTSVGRRDEVPEVVADRGEVRVHGVGLKPGHPVGFGVVAGTPVVMLPGYPVSCLVTAVQLLRPALAWREGREPGPFPATQAMLDGKLASEPGVRTFARVALDRGDGEPVASPVHTGGAGVLSSVTAADGWVVIPESTEGYQAGDPVSVQHWEARP